MFAPQSQPQSQGRGVTTGSAPQAPAGNTSYRAPAGFNPLGLLTGAAAGLLGFFLNRDERDPASPSIVTPDASSLVSYTFEPEWVPTFVPSYSGGAAAVLKPHLTGSSNNDGSYQPDPCVYGDGYKFFPPKAAVDFTEEIDGEQYLNCLFNTGYGELVMTEHKIGSKDLEDFENIEYEIRSGTTSDDPITLYAQDVDVKELNDELEYNEAIVRTASQTADRLLVDITAPNGLYATTADAGLGSITNGIFPTSVTVKVEYREAGSGDPWTDAGDCVIEAGPSAPATKTLDWEVTRGDYEVRCTRETDEDSAIGIVEWKNLKAVDRTRKPTVARKDQNGDAIGTGWTALRVKADDTTQGTLENYSNIAKRKIQAWNGSSWDAAAVTANPAWIYADMLCGTWNKRSISRSQLDTDSLAEWATYCDDMGFGFRYVYDQKLTLFEALKQVTAVALASPARTSNGKYGVVIDKPKTTVAQMFGTVNSRDFEGSITWPEPVDAINVRYVETNHWNQDERPVYADGIDSDTADKTETLSFVGLTDKEQAWKLGRYHMAVAKLRREKYYITVDVENLRCDRGDLVLLNHDVTEFGIGSARISALVLDGSNNIEGIVLDDTLPTELGVEHDIKIRLPDGTILTKATIGTGETTDTFTFMTEISSGASDKPAVGDLVFFGGYVQCLVEHKEYLNDLEARLTLVDYAPGVFQSMDGEIPDYDPQITKVTPLEVTIPAPVIDSVVSDETALLKDIDGSYRTRVRISVASPPSVVRYHQTQIRLSGLTAWQPALTHNVKNGNIWVPDVQDGDTIDIRVRHLTRLGLPSEWTLITGHFVIGKTTPPPDVPGLEIVGTHVRALYDNTTLEEFGQVVPTDWAGLRWKIDIGGLANWDNAQIFLNLTTSLQVPLANLPSGTYTLMVKAVDVAGNESENAAILRAFFGDPVLSNVIETTTDSPEFTAGTITGGSVVSDELVADEDSDSFWTNNSASFWTGNPDDLFWQTVYTEMQYYREFVPIVSSVAPMQLSLDLDMVGESIQILYRRQGTSLFWETYVDADDDPVWDEDDTELFWQDDGAYAIWPGAINITNETVEFKFIALSSSFIQGKITGLSFVLDVPDESEVLESVIIDTAGTRLPITKNYRSIKTVNWSIEYDASYPDAFVAHIIDRDTSGPLIKVFDTSGTPAQGKIHAIIQGVAA